MPKRKSRAKPIPAKLRRRLHRVEYDLFHPIWQRIEGEWKKFYCRKCKSASFRVLDQEELFVNVRCAKDHKNRVLTGFRMEKPD
jgi:RNase P subunit RPR2